MGRRKSKKVIWSNFFKLTWKILKFGCKAFPLAFIMGICFYLSTAVEQMLFADPYFQVARVTVYPSGVLSAGELTYLERETKIKSIMEIDLKEVSHALTRNPWVEKAEVSRNFPNEINVKLDSRKPIVQVQLKNMGRFLLLSDTGVVLEKNDLARSEFLVVEDFSASRKSYSAGTLYDSGSFSQLTELIRLIEKETIVSVSDVSHIIVDQSTHWMLVLNDGVTIKFGKAVHVSQQKAAVLKALLTSSERAQLLYVDARYDDVIIKKK
jgi:cell division septal protein FtsQ